MSAKAIALLLLSGLTGCTSFWTQRDHQKVQWSDGDDARIEVWLRQGSVNFGQPWLTLSDVLATPVLWIADVQFAGAALASDDARIEGGAFGFLVSMLPCFTCVPLDNHPSVWLHLSSTMQLGPEDRAALAGLGESKAVGWLAERYAEQFPDDADAPRRVRYWVSGVRLQPGRRGGGAAAVTPQP